MDYIVKRLHRFFNGSVTVESVALKHVDVVKLQTLKTTLDRREDILHLTLGDV